MLIKIDNSILFSYIYIYIAFFVSFFNLKYCDLFVVNLQTIAALSLSIL